MQTFQPSQYLLRDTSQIRVEFLCSSAKEKNNPRETRHCQLITFSRQTLSTISCKNLVCLRGMVRC
jgi:hypothetical protein